MIGQEIAANAHVVRPGRVDADRERQSEDLDEDAALRTHRPAAAPPWSWNVVTSQSTPSSSPAGV
ncbi:MAG TPA: hypothetical protein VEO91_09890, partial [Candidatus Limnocylindria bacterium]|nr:hypothetical protein [Candidatus Limnocylindria bacterium]